MNHPNADEQAMIQEHPGDFSERTRNDVADQQDQILAGMRANALAARREHVADQGVEHPPESVGVRAASQRLSRLVRRAQDGETFVITVNGRVAAQLCPVVPRIDAKEEV